MGGFFGGVHHRGDHVGQVLRRDRLGQIGGHQIGTGVVDLLVFGHTGQEHKRYGSLNEVLDDLETRSAGHVIVADDQRCRIVGETLECLSGRLGLADLVAFVDQNVGQHQAGDGVVIDDENFGHEVLHRLIMFSTLSSISKI